MNTNLIHQAINDITAEIDPLVKENSAIARKRRKISKKYSYAEPITSGPDRGYSNQIWTDPRKQAEHDGLDDMSIDQKLQKLRKARASLKEALTVLEAV